MSYDPKIAEARRIARAHARDTGIPHQKALDLVARSVDRADWTAFCDDPVEVTGMRPGSDAARTSGAGSEPIADAPESRIPSPSKNRRISLLLGALGLAFTVPVATTVAAVRSGDAFDAATRLDGERSRAPVAELASVVTGVRDRSFPFTVREDGRGIRTVRIVYSDRRRPAPDPYLERIVPFLRATGIHPVGFWHSMANGVIEQLEIHPVMRISGRIDCKASNWTMTAVEAADDYVGPASRSTDQKAAPARVISTEDRDALCSPNALKRTRILERNRDRPTTSWD